MVLEQMYLIPVQKILVLEPNCWETLTEFYRHKSRMRDFLWRKLGHCHSEIRLFCDAFLVRNLVHLF